MCWAGDGFNVLGTLYLHAPLYLHALYILDTLTLSLELVLDFKNEKLILYKINSLPHINHLLVLKIKNREIFLIMIKVYCPVFLLCLNSGCRLCNSSVHMYTDVSKHK